jgi:uncharacterized protein YycO
MEFVGVIFGRSYKPISLAIQLRTWCKWSHVGLLVPGTELVIEARGGVGVVYTTIEDFKDRYLETCTGKIACASQKHTIEYAKSRIGVSYDNKAFWGIGLGLDIHDINAYQCAELVASSTPVFPTEGTPFLVPKDLWRVTHDRKKSR